MRGNLDISKRAFLAALVLHVAAACALLLVPSHPRPRAAPPEVPPPYELAIDVASTPSSPAPPLPAPPPPPALAPALALAPAPAPAFAPEARPAAADHPRTGAEAKRAAETMLRDPSRRRERELGLGPEGPVLRALGDATTASFAPVKGRAVFRAVADGTGVIVGIEVVSCDGARDGWLSAAELGDGAQATQVKILDPLSLNAFALNGDPTDIGATPRRVVHTRLLDSEVL